VLRQGPDPRGMGVWRGPPPTTYKSSADASNADASSTSQISWLGLLQCSTIIATTIMKWILVSFKRRFPSSMRPFLIKRELESIGSQVQLSL